VAAVDQVAQGRWINTTTHSTASIPLTMRPAQFSSVAVQIARPANTTAPRINSHEGSVPWSASLGTEQRASQLGHGWQNGSCPPGGGRDGLVHPLVAWPQGSMVEMTEEARSLPLRFLGRPYISRP
jgi:hypothetical protein